MKKRANALSCHYWLMIRLAIARDQRKGMPIHVHSRNQECNTLSTVDSYPAAFRAAEARPMKLPDTGKRLGGCG